MSRLDSLSTVIIDVYNNAVAKVISEQTHESYAGLRADESPFYKMYNAYHNVRAETKTPIAEWEMTIPDNLQERAATARSGELWGAYFALGNQNSKFNLGTIYGVVGEEHGERIRYTRYTDAAAVTQRLPMRVLSRESYSRAYHACWRARPRVLPAHTFVRVLQQIEPFLSQCALSSLMRDSLPP